MTNEKAIEIIRRYECNAEHYEACEMAIKALEQQPCEDAVSRKELLKIYEDRFMELQKLKRLKENKGAEDIQLGVNYCINILKELPTITLQPKIGHWIMTNDYFTGAYETIDYVKCSCCGEDSLEEGNFCPNCGAEMESEIEE